MLMIPMIERASISRIESFPIAGDRKTGGQRMTRTAASACAAGAPLAMATRIDAAIMVSNAAWQEPRIDQKCEPLRIANWR